MPPVKGEVVIWSGTMCSSTNVFPIMEKYSFCADAVRERHKKPDRIIFFINHVPNHKSYTNTESPGTGLSEAGRQSNTCSGMSFVLATK